MEARSFRIEEDRRADLDLDIAVADRIDGADALADAGLPVLEQTEPHPVLEMGRIGDRGHIAFVVLHHRRLADAD
jgi:hypothetical protein